MDTVSAAFAFHHLTRANERFGLWNILVVYSRINIDGYSLVLQVAHNFLCLAPDKVTFEHLM
jgi:hypothetical protein